MSTKQRGDVEKVSQSVADFRVYMRGDAEWVSFTREEFRRIWEAGNREFGGRLESGGWHHESMCIQKIAQLKQEIWKFERSYTPGKIEELEKEIMRLRGRLSSIVIDAEETLKK